MDMSQMMDSMKEKEPSDKMGGESSLEARLAALEAKVAALEGEESSEEESPEEMASESSDEGEGMEASAEGVKKPKVAMIIAMLKKKKQAEGKY